MGFTGLKSRCLQGHIPSEALGVFFPSLFPASNCHLHSLAHGPLSILKASSITPSNVALSLSFSFCPVFPSLLLHLSLSHPSLHHHISSDSTSLLHRCLWRHWAHLENPRYSPLLKILALIPSAKCLLPSGVTHSKVPGIRAWILQRAIILSTTVAKTTQLAGQIIPGSKFWSQPQNPCLSFCFVFPHYALPSNIRTYAGKTTLSESLRK